MDKVPDVGITLRKYRDSVMRHIQQNKATHINNQQLLGKQKINDTNLRLNSPGVTNNSYHSKKMTSPLSEESL